MKILNTLLTACLAIGATQVYAVEKPSEAQFSWGIGTGFLSEDEGYKEADTDNMAVPILLVNYGDFYLMGPKFGYQLSSSENYKFGLTGSYRLDGYEADDSPYLTGMDDRDGTLDVGFEYSYNTGFGSVGMEVVADTLGNHEGYQADFNFSYPIGFDNGELSPYIGAQYRSDDLVNYYYGVKETEVTAFRPFYEAESAVNLVTGIRSSWFSGPHHRFVAMLEYASYDDSIKDSPIVDADNGYSVILGYAYVF